MSHFNPAPIFTDHYTTDRPDVSVIVPCYNYDRYVARCLESISAQTLLPTQVILVDDGSNDNSRDVLADWASKTKDLEVMCLFYDQNGGKNHALNLAFDCVRGSFTSIVDADDILMPFFFETLLAAAQQSGRDFVYCDNELIDEDGDVIGLGRSCDFDANLVRTASFIPDNAPTRTNLIRTVLPLDESVRKGTKHHRWQRLVAGGARGHYVNQPLFQYRMHTQNLSGIGDRIKADLEQSVNREPMLSQYWPLEARET